MFTIGLMKIKEVNQLTTFSVDEALIKNKKTILQYIIAILLESKLVDNKEQARPETHYDFKQEDLMKEIDGYINT